MAFRFRPVFGNGNLSPFFYQLYKFYLRTVKYRYEFVHCHVAVSSVKLAANTVISIFFIFHVVDLAKLIILQDVTIVIHLKCWL